MSDEQTVPVRAIDASARKILSANWRAEGYTVPNARRYPFQWLWDSCFHAIVWSHLGEHERAIAELTHVFRNQDRTGFVPHIDYEAAPTFHSDFWGRTGASSITQPPMYGHALAELHRRNVKVPNDLLARAVSGLEFLFDARARDSETGLITIVHPWESGADDSPRWDFWRDHGPEGSDWPEGGDWFDMKGLLLESVVRSPSGAPIANPAFGAAPVDFNALVAFNAIELATVNGDLSLVSRARELVSALEGRWDEHRRTWVDAGAASATSGRIRTLDALLVALVDPRHAPVVLGDVMIDESYGGAFGPAGVHRDEQAFAPRAYWRGPAWPQLTYLLWVATRGSRDAAAESWLATRLVDGAHRSGFAEYWDPDDGTALGARPQSWATLAAVVDPGPV